jgi:ribosomal-protein-alanine N-acetyltransferase
VIRRATPADRPALDRLQSHLSRPSPELLDAALSELSPAVDPTGPGGSTLSAFDVFVATADEQGAVVGYLLAVRGDPTRLAEIVVAPDHRRTGHARALLDRFFADLAERRADGPGGPDRIRLAVAPDNEPALGLYRSVGFTVVRRDAEYFDGDPALLLAKPLGGESA